MAATKHHWHQQHVLERSSLWVSVWVTKRLPPVLIVDTWQILLSVAWFGMGIGTLLTIAQPSVTASTMPLWVRVEWCLTFILGGVFQVVALNRSLRALERAGMALSAIACLTYAFALFSTPRPASWVIGAVFVTFAAAYAIRIMASSAGGVETRQL
jgi:hypothetical protein